MKSENKISSKFENKEDQAQICAEGSEEEYITHIFKEVSIHRYSTCE